MAEEAIGEVVGEAASALEDVVEVGLGEAGLASEAAFGDFTAVEAVADVADEALVEVGEVHGDSISRRNRGRKKPDVSQH